MEQIFLNEIKIKKVRHLQDISIPLSKDKRKHLILTGKNGSGKTSVLEALVSHLQYAVSDRFYSEEELEKSCDIWRKQIGIADEKKDFTSKKTAQKNLKMYEDLLSNWKDGAVADCDSIIALNEKYQAGNFVLAYYEDERESKVELYKDIEKVELERKYEMTANPGQKLTKYLVNLKATQAFSKKSEKAQKIENWFTHFQEILRKIYEDPALELRFDDESFQFSIHESGREPFDFNTMSRGYAAVFDIINDLIIRMEANSGLRDRFDMEGIVVIDEIETHLHLELQKKILPMLTGMFPNLQFIVSTHSPFVLNSLDDAVIYDLENGTLVSGGMKNLPYEGIVEGYFGADRLSDELRAKFTRYQELTSKSELSDDEYAEIEALEYYLDEIPDYLATELTTEYSRLKLEFANRG